MTRTAAAALAALLLAAAHAGAVDFTTVLLDDDGCPLKNDFTQIRTTETVGKPECPKSDAFDPRSGRDRPDLVLGDLAHYLLNVTIPVENPQPSGTEKYQRHELAARVRRAKDDPTSESEIALIKKLIGIASPPMQVYPAFQALDGKKAAEK
jgi:hypothetical protein